MLDTLAAIKNELQSNATSASLVPSGAIFITDILDYVPANMDFPCISIKDSDTDIEMMSTGVNYSVKEKVIVTAYQIWKEDADAVDASTGIVKIIEDIRSVLDNNDLGITNVLNCYTINISPSELLTMSSLVTIKKSATLIIEKYEASSI